MIKKLLLIFALAVPLFGQTQSTSYTWTSLGYVYNSGVDYTPQLFSHNDSLYAIGYNGSQGRICKWEGGTTWSVPINSESYYAQNYFYAVSNAYFGNHQAFSAGDYIFTIMTRRTIVSSVRNQSNQTIRNNMATLTRSASSNQPAYTLSYGPSPYMKSKFVDSLIAYTNSAGYDSDTLIYRSVLPTDGSTGTWAEQAATNLRMNEYGSWEGRRALATWELGSNVFVVLGCTQPYSAKNIADTLWFYKADSLGLTFSLAGRIDNADDIYGGVNSQVYTVGDTIAYFLYSIDADTSMIYQVNEDGIPSEVSVPTNLSIFGLGVLSNGTLLVSVNDNSIAGTDSAKVYIRDVNGNWQWTKGFNRDADGKYRIPTAFVEVNNKVYGYHQPYQQANTTDLSTDAYLQTTVVEMGGFLTLTSPKANDSYTAEDITVSWIGSEDTVIAYVSSDNINWEFVDTLTSSPYLWEANDILSFSISGDMYFLITSLDSTVSSSSGLFTYIGLKNIEILYPSDTTATIGVGTLIDIVVRSIMVDSISLFYSVGDSLNWLPIATNIATPDIVTITTYQWALPNVYGAIYLLATENLSADTVDITALTPYTVGTSIPSQPAICWYPIEVGVIQQRWYYDQTCGWGPGAPFTKVTSTIKSSGFGYDYIYETCNEGSYSANLACATTNPLTQGYVWIVNGLDTTATSIEDLYTTADTLTYKLRRYYVGTADSIFYCDDLVNGIDSLVICDLREYFGDFFTDDISSLTLYNIQTDKLQNDTLDINDIGEDLNDEDFSAKILITGPVRRGTGSLVFEALDQPNSTTAVYDIARIFGELNITRDYFRGIDPKARKSGR